MFSKLKILLIVFVISLSAGNTYTQCRMGDEDKSVYDQMRFSMQNHLYSDAKIRAKILITKYGDACPNLYYDAGWLSFMTESWWDAVEFLKLSLWKLSYDKVKFEFAYSGVGIAYYELGYFKESVGYLDEAIRKMQRQIITNTAGLAITSLKTITTPCLISTRLKRTARSLMRKNPMHSGTLALN
jgi:tetratricopeptide (TPR) repeat protein